MARPLLLGKFPLPKVSSAEASKFKLSRDVSLTGVVSGHLHLGCDACRCAVLLLVLLHIRLQLYWAVRAELRELGLNLLAPLLTLLNISTAHALKTCSQHRDDTGQHIPKSFLSTAGSGLKQDDQELFR